MCLNICIYPHIWYRYGTIYMYISTYMALIMKIYEYIHIYGTKYMYVSTYMALTIHTGWRRLIGSPKLQIIFHKRATKYRSLLRKMTYKDKGSYESSPPCIYSMYYESPSH